MKPAKTEARHRTRRDRGGDPPREPPRAPSQRNGNGRMMLPLGIVRPELDLEALSPLDYLLLSVAISVLSAEHELERQKVQGPDVGN